MAVDAATHDGDEGGGPSGGRGGLAVGAGAGALTMVALCFANGLQGAASTTYAQSTEALKHAFHVKDVALGIVPFGVALAGNLGAVPVAALCARHRRTAILSGMFCVWGVLIALAGLAPTRVLGLSALGFGVFAIFRIASASMEATDPATYPLIADWWPVERRASKVSVFNTLSAAGGLLGLGVAGVLVDHGAWRIALVLWLPVALIGAVLIKSRQEPPRGAQDAAYRDRLEQETTGAEHERVVEVVELEAEAVASAVAEGTAGDRWAVVRAVARLRSWRMVALGITVTGLMGSGFMSWGVAYFKRTFALSGTQAAGLAPLLGLGAFLGVFSGGFLADWLLARGVLRARLYVTALGFASSGLVLMLAFVTTRLLVAAPLLALGSGLATLPLGPQFALLMDVTPAPMRSQASAALNVLQATGALGPLLVGLLSTAFGENLRLALLCMSPFYLAGAAIIFSARTTYVEDVALVVAEARGHTDQGPT